MCSVIICTLSSPASLSRSPDSSAAWARKDSSGGSSSSVLSAAKLRAALTSSARFSMRASLRASSPRASRVPNPDLTFPGRDAR